MFRASLRHILTQSNWVSHLHHRAGIARRDEVDPLACRPPFVAGFALISHSSITRD
jgi:hypothetical protein